MIAIEQFKALFAQAESDPTLSGVELKSRITQLRTRLLKAQYARLRENKCSLLIVIAGIDGSGRGATVNLLNEWMDARHIRTLAFGPPTAEDKQRPLLWRYWRALPPKGHTGIVFGSWYAPLLELLCGKNPDRHAIERLTSTIRDFETTLALEGVQVCKLWYHLSKEAQAVRTKRQP